MQLYRDMGLIAPEVLIRGEDCQATAGSDGANQEVDIRALNALLPTQIEKFGREFVVFNPSLQIGKGSQPVAQRLEIGWFAHARKYFLTHRANHLRP